MKFTQAVTVFGDWHWKIPFSLPLIHIIFFHNGSVIKTRSWVLTEPSRTGIQILRKLFRGAQKNLDILPFLCRIGSLLYILIILFNVFLNIFWNPYFWKLSQSGTSNYALLHSCFAGILSDRVSFEMSERQRWLECLCWSIQPISMPILLQTSFIITMKLKNWAWQLTYP